MMSTPATPNLKKPPPKPKGPCSLGEAYCTAKTQELSDLYKCRHCSIQLHGFSSGCSTPKNPNDFRAGVICKVQPCGREIEGAAVAAAAGLPQFLWETQRSKRQRKDPQAPKLKRQRYTKEMKQLILQTLDTSPPGTTLADVAKQFQIPPGTLRGWRDELAKTQPPATDDPGTEPITEQILDPVPDSTFRIEVVPPVDATTDPPRLVLVPNVPGGGENGEGAVAAQKAAVAATTAQEEEDDDDDEDKQIQQKGKRQRYPNDMKVQVIIALKTQTDVTLTQIAKQFGVPPGTVRGWREEADKIHKAANEHRRAGAKANPSKDPLQRIWNAILDLFEKNSRLPVGERLQVNVEVVRTIGRQARDSLLKANERLLFLGKTEQAAMEKFKASETWARKWARDHNVITTISTKTDPIDAAVAAVSMHTTAARLKEIQPIVAKYPAERVYTIKSAGLFYKILPHRTYVVTVRNRRVRATKGLKCKDFLTLYCCTNESGSHKLPITCINKYKQPQCFRSRSQRILPYIPQKKSWSDSGTFQNWWREVFLPHIRETYPDMEDQVLLVVEDSAVLQSALLKDPTNQVRVEALPSATSAQTFQPLESIVETTKRRYRYRLLHEVMEIFDERMERRQVATSSGVPMVARGLREGHAAHMYDAMRLLRQVWDETLPSTIQKAFEKAKLRLESDTATPAGRQKNEEKKLYNKEKKQLVKDLNAFLNKHEEEDASNQQGANQLEDMVEKLKNCFLYTDGEVIETKEMIDSLDEWVGLEEEEEMTSMFIEELKDEMNIDFLVGLKQAVEGTVPEAEEGEEPEGVPENVAIAANEELDVGTAIELASTIKSTASKLFQHGDILGDLAVRLDEASDGIFRLLRKQEENAAREAERKVKAPVATQTAV